MGRTSDDAHLLLNLEAVGALTINADTPDQVRRAITTLAAELTVSPRSAELSITLVGTGADLAAAVGHPRVRHVDDLDSALNELERTAAEQRPFLETGADTDATVASKRLDVDLAEAWAPHLLLVGVPMNEEQTGRVADLVTSLPRVAIAAATTGAVPQAWRYRLGGEPLAGQLTVALHEELEWELVPTMLTDKIMVADRAGDHDEVRRLIGKVSANARALELDLSDDTQDVLAALARS